MKNLTRAMYRWYVRWVRSCLYLWVRTQVSGLGVVHAKAGNAVICYALERKSLSSLAVLVAECERAGLPSPLEPLPAEGSDEHRSWFYLWPRRRIRSYPRKPLRNAYVGRLLRVPVSAAPVVVVPVTIAWGRAPDRPESFFRRLTSDAWGISGRFRHLLMILVHGRQTVVQFGEPLDLDAFAGGAEPDNPEGELVTHLRRHFRNVRTGIVGPDLSHRRTLFDAILAARG